MRPSFSSWRSIPAMAWAAAAALAVRLWILSRFGRSLYFEPSSGDMKFYADWGRLFADGRGVEPRAFLGLPGYPFLLGGVFGAGGFSPYTVALLQTFLDLGTAGLMYGLALWAFPGPRARWIGALSALGWVLFPAAQAFSLLCMPTTLGIFAFWAVVFWSVRTESRSRWKPWAGIGLLIGLAATAVGTVLVTIPIPLAAAIRNLRKPGASLAAAACLLGGVAAGTAPCWVHNVFVAGEPVFLSAHAGLNFWIGNHPGANGYPRMTPGLRSGQAELLKDAHRLAEEAEGRPLRRYEVSRYWSGQARAWIREHPGAWLRLLALKARNFWNAARFDDLSVINPMKAEGVILPGPGFGGAAALALAGLALAWRRSPRSRWIAAAAGLQMAAILPVFVTERYRLAAVPGLLVLGAGGAVLLFEALRPLRWPRLAAWLAGGAAGAVLAGLPVREPELQWLDAYNHGLKLLEKRKIAPARVEFEQALAFAPEQPDINAALGTCALCVNDLPAAKRHYGRALELNPQTVAALNNLAIIALLEKRWTDALGLLDKALGIDPDDAKMRALRKICVQKMNRP